MKTPEQERLITDVLQNESYGEFRAQLRQTMLAEVRRTRRNRRLRPLLALAACVPLAFAAHWLLQVPDGAGEQPAGIATVRTIPLRADQIVITRRATPNVAVVTSRQVDGDHFAVVSTVTFPDSALSDDEVLKLFEGRAVALVSLESGKKLLFLDEPVTGDQ